jgi:hypothetical protein
VAEIGGGCKRRRRRRGAEALAQGESVNQRGAKWRAGVLGKLREVMAQEGGWPVRRPRPAGPDSWRGFKWI